MAENESNSKKTRSKTGCMTCRRRKVRCGEQRPICNACDRLNLDCSYLNSIVAPSSKRPRSSNIQPRSTLEPSVDTLVPRASSSLSNPQSHFWWSSLEEGLLETNWLEQLGLEYPDFLDNSSFTSLELPSQSFVHQSNNLCRNATLLPEDREVLQHFTSTMVRYCILRNTVHSNLYIHILTSLALFHSTLLDAMLSWSALHLAHLRRRTFDDAKLRYNRTYTALIEDLAHNTSPTLLLATIWFLMQYQLMLAEGVDGFCELLNLAADVARAEFQASDTETSMKRIGPIGSLILVWMSARDSQIAYLGMGGRLLGCLRSYPHVYELVEISSVSDEAENPDVQFMSREEIAARPVPSEMQACLKLSLRSVTLGGQIKILGRHHGMRTDSSAWETIRASLEVLRCEIEEDQSLPGIAALAVAEGDVDAMPVVTPICYNRLLLLAGYYTTLIEYNKQRGDDDLMIRNPQDCANRVIRLCQRASMERPNSPQAIWPTQILMAALTTRDPVYQSWVIGAFKDAERWGSNMVKTRKLLEEMIRRQKSTGEKADLIEVMKETTGLFLM